MTNWSIWKNFLDHFDCLSDIAVPGSVCLFVLPFTHLYIIYESRILQLLYNIELLLGGCFPLCFDSRCVLIQFQIMDAINAGLRAGFDCTDFDQHLTTLSNNSSNINRSTVGATRAKFNAATALPLATPLFCLKLVSYLVV